MILVSFGILEAFAWLPIYPVWSAVIIAVDVFVIWTLTVHGHDIESLNVES